MNAGVAAGAHSTDKTHKQSFTKQGGFYSLRPHSLFPGPVMTSSFLFLRGDGGANLRAETLTDSPVYSALAKSSMGSRQAGSVSHPEGES